MAKDKLTDYSATNSLNTDVGGVNIDEGMLPSDVNNALREVMTHLKDFAEGTQAVNNIRFAGATTTGDINFGDNDKAVFGAGSDLQIYHDGTQSIIEDVGTGPLRIRSNSISIENELGTETISALTQDGAVTIYYDGSPKLATTSSGIDVTGTVTADRLLSIDTTGTNYSIIENKGAGALKDTLVLRNFSNNSGTGAKLIFAPTINDATIRHSAIAGVQNGSNNIDMRFYTSAGNDPVERMRIKQNGDISFYDNTGVTQGLFWDANEVRLGLGTTSPARNLHLYAENADASVRFQNTANSKVWEINPSIPGVANSGISIVNVTDSTVPLHIDNSGNVGIGTSSVDNKLHLENAGTLYLQIENTSTANKFYVGNSNGNAILESTGAYSMVFKTNSSEAARFDSSGNLLVSKSASDRTVAGGEILSSGGGRFTRDGADPLYLNRLSDDGTLISLRRNDTTVGSIESFAGTYIILRSGGNVLYLDDNVQAYTDNTWDMGGPSNRWDDVYATNGTIQTSDANEKQDIEALSDAEQRVAVAAKGLLRKYRWKSSVEEKGDDARIHFGIIAQDLKAAFEAEGLDAGRYAMFINSEWTDEETGEQKSRMGIRYNQLLAFIIAAI